MNLKQVKVVLLSAAVLGGTCGLALAQATAPDGSVSPGGNPGAVFSGSIWPGSVTSSWGYGGYPGNVPNAYGSDIGGAYGGPAPGVVMDPADPNGYGYGYGGGGYGYGSGWQGWNGGRW